MKKIIALFLVVLMLFSFASCKNVKEEEATDLPTYEPLPETVSSTEEQVDVTNGKDTSSSTTTTTKPQVTVTVPDKETSGSVVTYYSENPNNKYIRAISERYGVDSSCLVALIKVNASTPGATVLQFTGEKDSSGNVIKNEKTLKYVYDVPDHGVIKKASGQRTDNDGYNYTESYVNYNLAVKYIVPQLDDMKRERTYENYFKN